MLYTDIDADVDVWPETDAVGGAALIANEANGFAADFTYATDAKRVAVKASNVVTEYAINSFFSNAGTSPKLVYDATGTLVWSPHNTILRSEDFSATWVVVGTPIVTTHTLQDDDPAASEGTSQLITGHTVGDTYTFTAWFLKDAVTSRFPALWVSGIGTRTVHLNTSTGAIASETTTLAGSSAVASDGVYWRLSITYVADQANLSLRIFAARGTVLGTVNVAAQGTVTVDKTQSNRGAVPTAYLPTTTAARYGLAVDYDPVTLAPRGLFVEPAATNLLIYNSNFGDASWTKTRITLVANAIAAPNGVLEATKLAEDTSLNTHPISRGAIVVTSAVQYTLSAYVKPAERTWVQIYDAQASNSAAWFNLSGAGVVGTRQVANDRATIIALANGWYRIEIEYTTTTTAATIVCALCEVDGSNSYQGILGSGLYLWGMQLETGSVATSMIPTFVASATRAADSYSCTAASINYSGTAGGWYCENYLISAVGTRVIGNTGAAAGPVWTTAGTSYILFSDTINLPKTTITALVGNVHKVASTYQVADRAITVDGQAAATDTNAATGLLAMTTIGVGTNGTAIDGYIRKLFYLPRRMSNAELMSKTA